MQMGGGSHYHYILFAFLPSYTIKNLLSPSHPQAIMDVQVRARGRLHTVRRAAFNDKQRHQPDVQQLGCLQDSLWKIRRSMAQAGDGCVEHANC